MPRLLLSDELWPKPREIMRQERIYDKPALRITVEGMLYRMRVGCPWRDLPKYFGNWNSVYKRFNAWSGTGKWLKIFKALVHELDMEWTFIDGSYAKAYQHSAGASSDEPQAIGKIRVGNTSKIHLAVDAYGLPIAFEITGGDINDCTAAPELLDSLSQPEVVIADKGYDSEKVREHITGKGARVVIPRKCNSIIGNTTMDW